MYLEWGVSLPPLDEGTDTKNKRLREGMDCETQSVPSGQLKSSQESPMLVTHCGPCSISAQIDPSSHTNWSQFRAGEHVTPSPVRLSRQNMPGPHDI